MKRLLFLFLLVAGCDSNEPTEDASVFFGSYLARDVDFVKLNIGINPVGSEATYWASLGFGSSGVTMDCEGDSSSLSCKENPFKFSSSSYTLTKTSYGVDMVGHFTYEFDEANSDNR